MDVDLTTSTRYPSGSMSVRRLIESIDRRGDLSLRAAPLWGCVGKRAFCCLLFWLDGVLNSKSKAIIDERVWVMNFALVSSIE